MNDKILSRFQHMLERCYNPNNKSYKNYGGRGIEVCDEWRKDYSKFESWAMNNGFQEDLSIDRIDNDGNYEPDNCRFVTPAENNQNRRSSRFYTIDGETKNLQQWCDAFAIGRATVNTRLERNWSIEEALKTPVKKQERDRTSLIGCRFGRLVVLAYAGDECIGSDNNSRWICQCDCGNQTIVGQWKLKSGHTVSCGCLVSEKARQRMLTDNPMKTEEQRQRMREHNPMKK